MCVSTLGYEMSCSVRAARASLLPCPLGAPNVVDGRGVCPCSTSGTRRGRRAPAKAYDGRGKSIVIFLFLFSIDRCVGKNCITSIDVNLVAIF